MLIYVALEVKRVFSKTYNGLAYIMQWTLKFMPIKEAFGTEIRIKSWTLPSFFNRNNSSIFVYIVGNTSVCFLYKRWKSVYFLDFLFLK